MVRIRVYPQGWFANSNGWGYGTRRRRSGAFYNMQLQAERQRNNLRLRYERALWAQQVRMTQLAGHTGAYGAYAGAYNTLTPPVYYNTALANPWLLNAMVATQLGGEVFNSGNTFWNSLGNIL